MPEPIEPLPDSEASPSERCPNVPESWVLVSASSGAVVSLRCGRNACWYCLPRNALRRAAAIRLAAPERFVTLTQAGEDFAQIRQRMYHFTADLRGLGHSLELVYSVEPNPKRTGNHVHAWQHGDYIPRADIRAAALRRGMGERVDIRRWQADSNEGYGLKGVGYGLKGAAALESGREYLLLNGRRLTHQTRGFWRSGGGDTLKVKQAERLASADPNGDPGPWSLHVL